MGGGGKQAGILQHLPSVFSHRGTQIGRNNKREDHALESVKSKTRRELYRRCFIVTNSGLR